jgi:hypothetical protein
MGYSGYVASQSNAKGIPSWRCSFRQRERIAMTFTGTVKMIMAAGGQKRGIFRAQEIDDAGDLIDDPRRACDTHYKFHSFFLVPRDKIILSLSEI